MLLLYDVMCCRGQTDLSWGALISARENGGPTSGAAGLLLGASRGLFPLSAGCYCRLLGSLVHSQVGGWMDGCRFCWSQQLLVVHLCVYVLVSCVVDRVPGFESRPTVLNDMILF